MHFKSFLQSLGEPISDPEEESFFLFTTPIPSANLGFIDSKSSELEISVHGRELQIQQSPGLLSSNLAGGTTGAVVWKVTPAFAEWISDPNNVFLKHDILNPNTIVLELGTGVSGVVALALARKLRKYIATDQEYVLRILKANIEGNMDQGKKGRLTNTNVQVLALDWETSEVSELSTLVSELRSDGTDPGELDAIIACDCIYNEALIPSFVDTCANLCRLRHGKGLASNSDQPTICIIAQQLRSNIVFEEWLRIFHQKFQVWRIPDAYLSSGLQEGNGFVVHIGVLR